MARWYSHDDFAGVVRQRLLEFETVDDGLDLGEQLGERRSVLLGHPPIPDDLAFSLAIFCWWPFKVPPAGSVADGLVGLRTGIVRAGQPLTSLQHVVPTATLAASWDTLADLHHRDIETWLDVGDIANA